MTPTDKILEEFDIKQRLFLGGRLHSTAFNKWFVEMLTTKIAQAIVEDRKRVDKEITKQFKYASENDNYDMRGVDWQSIIHPSDKLPDKE